MGLQTEIWLAEIIEGLFANNSFAARSVDHSQFTNNKKVHVPNAGSAPSVVKNRNSFPASIGTRTDYDLEYEMNEYTTDPIRIPHAETVELSYDKRQSVMSVSKAALADAVFADMIYSWIPTSPTVVKTMGAGVLAHLPSATGSRKSFNKATVKAIKKAFDKDNIPSDGRYILVDSDMYNQLLDSLTDTEANNVIAGANPETGTIGMYMGFGFYMRSTVAKSTSNGVLKAWSASASATDCAAGIAWHDKTVSRAIGQQEMFEDEKNPSYFSDIMSFLVRAGGAPMRYDNKGVIMIYQDTQAALAVTAVVKTDETVAAADDGTITITAAGGVAPYLYSIDNGTSWSQSNAFTGLTHTTYNVKVLDSAGTVAAYSSNPVTIAAGA